MNQETGIGSAIQDVFRLLGVPYCRVHSGSVRVRGGYMQLADEGFPDWWTALGWIETKTEEGELSSAQREKHAELRRWRQRVAVARSARQAMTVMRRWLEEDSE